MATSQIVGTIKGSVGELISGKFITKLDAPLVDSSTTPDSIHYPKEQVHVVTNGNLNTAVPTITLNRSDEVTYTFRFTYTVTDLILYLDGIEYAKQDYNGLKTGGPWHTHTDTFKYTGEVHSAQSELLTTFNRQYDLDLFNPFHAHILTTYGTTVEWSELQHSSINTSNIDTSAFFIAGLIVERYKNQLVSELLVPRGDWLAGTVYNKNDVVRYPSDNNAYWYINDVSSSGNLPTNTTYWMLIIEGSDVTPDPIDPSTVILDTAYGVAWNGVTNKAPSADKIYDEMVGLARLADATFGILKAPTKGPSTNTTDVATTAFVQTAVSGISVPPATTAPNVDLWLRDTKIVNMNTLHKVTTKVAYATSEKIPGQDGGPAGSSISQRLLTNLLVNFNGCSNGLTSGYIQVPPGVYEISAGAATCGGNNHRLLLRSSTGVDLILGGSRATDNRGYQLSYLGNDWAEVNGYVESASTINLGLFHYIETRGSSTDFGRACFSGGNEIYAWIKVRCLGIYQP